MSSRWSERSRPAGGSGVMSAGELWRMPHRGRRLELIRGELRAAEPTGSRHGRVAMRIAIHLGNHVHAGRLGVVFAAETGYWIERDPDTVRAPDVAFVSRARFEAVGDTAAFWPGPPDLAVEVLSPEDRPGAVREKVADWLRAGCEMVLVVDPERRSVVVYGPARAPVRLGSAAVIDGEHVVPGWRMPVAAAFEVG